MLIRTLTGLILIPLLLVVLFAPMWTLTVAVALVSGIATYEMIRHWKPSVKTHILWMSCTFSAVLYTLIYVKAQPYYYMAAFFLFLVVLFLEILADPEHFGFLGLSGVFFSAMIIPAMFSSVVRIAGLPNRAYVVLIPFLITISSDVFALYSGKLFGRHKLAPVISPNKTVEGAVGGFVCCIGVLLGYGAVITALGCTVSYPRLLVYAVLGGLVSQLGDLALSAAKRSLGIKDFGNIFPGHGGVLDRFDSILFVAPLLEMLMVLIPAVSIP